MGSTSGGSNKKSVCVFVHVSRGQRVALGVVPWAPFSFSLRLSLAWNLPGRLHCLASYLEQWGPAWGGNKPTYLHQPSRGVRSMHHLTYLFKWASKDQTQVLVLAWEPHYRPSYLPSFRKYSLKLCLY